MKVQSRISSFAIALLIAISTLAYIVAAEPSAEKTASCSANGEGFSSTTCEEDPSATNAASINTPDKSDYHDHCHVWPPEGVPVSAEFIYFLLFGEIHLMHCPFIYVYITARTYG